MTFQIRRDRPPGKELTVPSQAQDANRIADQEQDPAETFD
jgi:hypothetical protein